METGKQHLSQHAGADVDANHAARGYCLGSQSCHQACTAVSNMASMELLIAVQGKRKLADTVAAYQCRWQCPVHPAQP